ncbi:MAG TPA: ABC transporter ATP-binding protein [Solirubrobacteraceae bacterium]|jgi:iron(III) transport system ATP-binding protein|nr:ABC transporter ATP-binding protein [Solirubrobacteraceae bacterium]
MSDLSVSGLHKSFGSHAVLKGLDLRARAGSFTAILGPSGSGKTTLLRLLAGFEAPDRGIVKIGARIVDGEGSHLNPEHRRIGYVPQEGGLFPHITVQANVTFGLPREDRRNGAAALLDLVGMADLAKRYPHQLSGGQQQRVALARALAVKPELVLLDEPFASLDAHLRVSVRDQVRQILRESHTTALLVTHDQDEALSLADQVAVLRDGRIAQCAPPHDLYAFPVDDEVARFVGEANLVVGTMEGELVQTSLGRLAAQWRHAPAPTPCQVSVLIRPEQIELRSPDAEGDSAGRVISSGYHGHDTVLHVQLASMNGEAPLVVRAPGNVHVPAGSAIMLGVRGPVLVWPVGEGQGG